MIAKNAGESTLIEDASSRERQSVNPISQQGMMRGIAKLFVHGMILTLLTYILVAGWESFVVVVLYSNAQYWLGLFLSVVVLVVGAGWANLKVANWLWDFQTVKTLSDFIVQGALLAIPLVVISVLESALFTMSIALGDDVALVLPTICFVFFTILMGFVGRSVAFWFRIPESTYEHPPSVQGSGETTVITKEGKRIVFRGTRSTCPKCRESDRYHEEDRSREGLVKCRECGHRFYVEPIESLLEKLGENVETRYTTDL